MRYIDLFHRYLSTDWWDCLFWNPNLNGTITFHRSQELLYKSAQLPTVASSSDRESISTNRDRAYSNNKPEGTITDIYKKRCWKCACISKTLYHHSTSIVIPAKQRGIGKINGWPSARIYSLLHRKSTDIAAPRAGLCCLDALTMLIPNVVWFLFGLITLRVDWQLVFLYCPFHNAYVPLVKRIRSDIYSAR